MQVSDRKRGLSRDKDNVEHLERQDTASPGLFVLLMGIGIGSVCTLFWVGVANFAGRLVWGG